MALATIGVNLGLKPCNYLYIFSTSWSSWQFNLNIKKNHIM